MNNFIKLFNGEIITPYRTIRRGSLLIRDSIITEVSEGNISADDAIEIDVGGKYIAPGFIDIHIHGGGGHDFMDGSTSAFLEIAKTHVKYGTTSMVPTTLTSDKGNIINTISLFDKAQSMNVEGSQFLGLHLEGPYFAMNQRGAQDPRYIRDPDPREYEEILSSSKSIIRWSAAPELKGALKFGRFLKSKGVEPAIAHTEATYDEVVRAMENGYNLVTHLYSGMLGVTRRNAFRYAGSVEAALLLDELFVELIADGVHLPPPLLRLAYKCKGADRIALISDSMRASDMPPGRSILGNINNGLEVIVEDGVAKLPDRSSFAGSVATADRLVRTMNKAVGIPLMEAVQMMTSTPASVMGVINKKGSLTVGKDADIIVFDNNINIEMTIVRGKIKYKA